MIHCIRTDSENGEFRRLVAQLDEELGQRDGAEHGFYAQFNTLDKIKHAVVALKDDQPVGCGALKAFSEDTMEVKRMYVAPQVRGQGVASAVLVTLETWAAELGYTRCVLETGQRQPEAIALYTKQGYQRIPNYGQYVGVENSLCFSKELGVRN